MCNHGVSARMRREGAACLHGRDRLPCRLRNALGGDQAGEITAVLSLPLHPRISFVSEGFVLGGAELEERGCTSFI